jgi:hypothetical protein
MAIQDSVPLGVRVSPALKETLVKQAETERRSLRTVVETILERATQQAEATCAASR